MNPKVVLPKFSDLMAPTLKALKNLGGSATVQEIYDQVCLMEGYSEEQQNIPHRDTSQSEIAYRLAWSRTYLKTYGAIENTARGVWTLTEKGKTLESLNQAEIIAFVKGSSGKSHLEPVENLESLAELTQTEEQSRPFVIDSEEWVESLLSVLQGLSPDAFERLCQRILRESGFIKVEVTGRKGDGGIDGIGVLKIALLSFQVLFQCKRYRGSVGASEIRDFRGSMVGRTDKGLLITTGSFTSGAKREATRDGAPPIDFIDGEELCQILKDLQLGVKTEKVEVVKIQRSWFQEL